MKPKGKRPGLLSRKLEPSETIESLCMDVTLERIKKEGKRFFKFKGQRKLYRPDELLGLLA